VLSKAQRSKKVRQIAITDDSLVAAIFEDGSGEVFDTGAGDRFSLGSSGDAARVNSVSWSRDGSKLYALRNNGRVTVWDVHTRRVSQEFSWKSDGQSNARVVCLSSDQKTLFIGGPKTSLVLSSVTGSTLRTISDVGEVLSADFFPDGKRLAVGAFSSRAQVLTLDPLRLVSIIGSTSQLIEPIDAVATRPEQSLLVTAGRTVTIWNTGSNQKSVVSNARLNLSPVVLSPNGKWLVFFEGRSEDNANGVVWNLESHRQDGTFPWKRVGYSLGDSVALSNEGIGTILRSDDGKTFRVDGFPSGVKKQLPGLRSANSAIFFPSGREVMVVDGDTVQVWDVQSGRLINSLTYALSSVPAVSPEQNEIAITDLKGEITVWSFRQGSKSTLVKTGLRGTIWLSYSPDGRYLLISGLLGDIGVLDVQTMALISQTKTGTPISSSKFLSPSFVVLSQMTGAVELWNWRDWKKTISLFSYVDGQWTTVDETGRFDSNHLDGTAPVHWIARDDALTPLPLEIFMRDYFTPGLLTKLLSNQSLPPIRSITALNRIQPQVEIIRIQPTLADESLVEVSLRVRNVRVGSRVSEAADLRLFRDGQLVGRTAGPMTFDKNGYFSPPSFVKMPSSKAKEIDFSAYAFKEDGVKSPTARLPFVPTVDQTGTRKPTAHLLAIGVNETSRSSSFRRLQFAVNDAQRMTTELAARLAQSGAWERVRTVTLTSPGRVNPIATKAGIRSALQVLEHELKPDDALFITFSGHGFQADKEFFLVPDDVDSRDGNRQKETAISASELSEWIRPIDAREIILIIDACQSAASVDSGEFKPGPFGGAGFGQLAYDKRMRVLAASQTDGFAIEDERLQHGLLTYALLADGLTKKEADHAPKDGIISVGEWLRYAVGSAAVLVAGQG